MSTRLLPLLIVLMAGVLLALGFPLAVSLAAAQQQDVVVDRIDDTARVAALAQFVSEGDVWAAGSGVGAGSDERGSMLEEELRRYFEVYGIRAGSSTATERPWHGPRRAGRCPGRGRGAWPSRRPSWGDAAMIPSRSGPGRGTAA